jgi:hypothetical protein
MDFTAVPQVERRIILRYIARQREQIAHTMPDIRS